MLTLAVDMSTSAGSLALLDGTRVVREAAWEESGLRNQILFSSLRGLLADTGTPVEAVGLFAVGIGPGAFSGLRISLAAFRGMALPGGKPVHAVLSPAALARACAADAGQTVVVAGDARRDCLWYVRVAGGVAAAPELAPREDIASLAAPGDLVVSPDWDRIGGSLESALPRATLVRERRTPRARDIAAIAIEQQARNEPSLPLKPVYMHPPVSARKG